MITRYTKDEICNPANKDKKYTQSYQLQTAARYVLWLDNNALSWQH